MNGKPLQGHDVPTFNSVDLIKFDCGNFDHRACSGRYDLHL